MKKQPGKTAVARGKSKVVAKVEKKVAAKKVVKVPPKPKPKPKVAAKKKPATKPDPRPAHRPSGYTEAIGEGVCGWIKQGYTLRQIAALPNMPDKATIIRWLAKYQAFCDQYARANDIWAMVGADEIREIADDARNDWMEREGKDGTVELVPNPELIQRSKLRIDTRKWLMSKMAPKRFGDNLAITGEGGGPVRIVQIISDMLDEIDGAGTGLPKHVKPA